MVELSAATPTRPTSGQLFATAYFWLVFALTLPFGVALGLLLFLFTWPFDPDRRWVHAYNCLWTFDYLRVNPLWRVRVEGRERLPRGPSVLVANHQSMVDVVALMGLRHPFKFVSKDSLFQLPLVGWMMRLALYVELDRTRRKSAQRMLQECQGWLARGMAVLLFPEGTYSPDGQLLPFRRGAFSLALAARVPVVPVAVLGTAGLMREDGPWMSPTCDIRVRVLEPIPAEALGSDPTELAARVRALLASALQAPSG